METKSDASKKTWSTPELKTHGTVESLTQQNKLKHLGTVDDFGVPGVSDAP